MKKTAGKGQYAAVWTVAVCLGAAYLLLCFNHNVWTDEAYTFWLIKNDYAEIVRKTATDVHPPLYYLIAKTAALLFPTYENRLLVQKITTMLPVILTMGIGSSWLLSRKFGMAAAVIFQISLGLLPCTMEYAVQVRMYSWGLFFITMGGIAAYDAFTRGKKRDWVMFTLMNLAAAYIHNFSFVSACVICGLLFLCIVIKNRKLLVPWLISAAVMILAYSPWFRVLLKQTDRVINMDYWIQPITWKTVWGYFEWAFDNGIQYSAIMVLILLVTAGIQNLAAIIRSHKKEDIFAMLCWAVPFFTAAGGVTVSLITTPIYYNRYVFPAMGLLCLFFGIALRKASKPFFVTMMFFLLCYGIGSYRDTFNEEYYSSYIVQTEAFFEENLGPNDAVVYNFEAYGLIYGYYFDEKQLSYMEDFDLGGDYDNIWFICTLNIGEYSPQTLQSYGLKSEYMGHMGIEMNEFDVYRIYRSGSEE